MSLPFLTIDTQIITDGAMSGDITSSVIDISGTVGYCVQAVWLGSPVGTIDTEASIDNTNFVPVASQITGGVDGQWLLNVEHAHYKYVRVIFTSTSGSGTLNCRLMAKEV